MSILVRRNPNFFFMCDASKFKIGKVDAKRKKKERKLISFLAFLIDALALVSASLLEGRSRAITFDFATRGVLGKEEAREDLSGRKREEIRGRKEAGQPVEGGRRGEETSHSLP